METTSVLVQSLLTQLTEVYEGEPWYGEPLTSKLNKIRQEAASPSDLNKTASYVQHLINWRKFVMEKFQGHAEFDFELNSKADWTEIDLQQFSDWDHLIAELRVTQEELIQLISHQNDDGLFLKVPGKNYTYAHMLHGLIQHEVYHTGQIAVYWKNR